MRIKELWESKLFRRLAGISLLCLCLGVNIYIRLFPAYFPQLKERAKVNVENKIWEEQYNKVKGLYPDFNPYAKEALVKELVKEDRKNKAEISRRVSEEYKRLKAPYQDDSGQTYLLEFDPYQWMRYTRNILKHGYPGDIKKGGKSYDTRMLAPVGRPVIQWQLFSYLTGFLYKAASFLFPSLSFYSFIFYIPVFYAVIFLIIIFAFHQYIFSSRTGAFFTAVFIGLSEFLVSRSCAGWYDYDMLNLIMPVLAVFFMAVACKNRNRILVVILCAVCLSLSMFLFSLIWPGWWFILLIILSFLAFKMVNSCLINWGKLNMANKENRHLFIFVLALFFWIFVLFSIEDISWFSRVYGSILRCLYLGGARLQNIWPNTYYSVGEVSSVDILGITGYLYGKEVFLGSLLFMLVVYWRKKRQEEGDFCLIMVIWFGLMLFASLKSVRFVEFLCVPLGFFYGAFFSEAVSIIKNRFFRARGLKFTAVLTMYLTWAAMFFWFFSCGRVAAEKNIPEFNDNWHKILIQIKSKTSVDSTINSWWDLGNWFKTIGERRVIFDGHSQNNPIAYWMGKVIVSQDERKAVSILRMLNNSSDTVFDQLKQYVPRDFEAKLILDKLLSLDRGKGMELLANKHVSEKDAASIVTCLHDEPSSAYFIVDASMLPKIGSISFLANWDFMKVYMLRNMQKPKEDLLKDTRSVFGVSLDKAEECYREIVLTPGGKAINESLSKRWFVRAPPSEGKISGSLLYFDNGLVYDLVTNKAILYYISSGEYKIPKKVFLFKDYGYQEMDNPDGDEDIGVLIFKAEDKYKVIIADEELIHSLLIRLFFLRGQGLKYFEPFIMDDEAKVYVYRIKWEAADE